MFLSPCSIAHLSMWRVIMLLRDQLCLRGRLPIEHSSLILSVVVIIQLRKQIHSLFGARRYVERSYARLVLVLTGTEVVPGWGQVIRCVL